MADRRFRRPRAVDQDAPDLRRRGRFRRRQSTRQRTLVRRAKLPLRRPRTRDGGDSQRHVALKGAPVRIGLHDLQRLLRAVDPSRRDHGDSGHPHLHARLHRRRRRRPDASADRASRRAARDSRPDRLASRRRQRSRRSVARHHATQTRAVGAGAQSASVPTIDRTKYASAEGVKKGAYVLADTRRRRRAARRDFDGDRFGSRDGRRGLRKADRRRRQGARRQHAVVGIVRASI